MAKVRPAHRCGARCRDGSACRAFAAFGTRRCRMHGGATPAAREAALTRQIQARFERAFQASWVAYEGRLRAWRTERILVTAELLDMPLEDVHWTDMRRCRRLYAPPDSIDDEPQFRWDERYKVLPAEHR